MYQAVADAEKEALANVDAPILVLRHRGENLEPPGLTVPGAFYYIRLWRIKMASLLTYKCSDLKTFMAAKAANIPKIITVDQEAQAVRKAFQKLNQHVFFPRFVVMNTPGKINDLPSDCDVVSRVIFPQESQWPSFFGGVDVTMYLFNRYQFINFDNIAEYGALAGT